MSSDEEQSDEEVKQDRPQRSMIKDALLSAQTLMTKQLQDFMNAEEY